jgi:hypothetical protein
MRKMIYVLIFVVSMFLSCSVPFYERAEITQGFSGGAGVFAAWEPWWVYSFDLFGSNDGLEVEDYYSAFGATAFLRYAKSERTMYFLEASFAPIVTFYETDGYDYVGDFQLGAKFKSGTKGAIRVTTGLPIIDVAYLYDFNDMLTGKVGLGYRGLQLGLGMNRKISDNLQGFTSFNIAVPGGFDFSFEDGIPPIAASIGVGVEIK